MTTTRILAVLGTRPEVIKMAPVIHELRKRSSQVQCLVCLTAQHREMLDQALTVFSLRPDFDLNLMEQGQTPSQMASRVLMKLEPLLADCSPDWMVVQGDTTTVMAASITAHHNRVRVAHVEAGLRTFDHASPFPEEVNRVITDHISDLHFAPTSLAQHNLLREGIPRGGIFITGNTAIDALAWVLEQPVPPLIEELLMRAGCLPALGQAATSKRLILVTAHRRENIGRPLLEICQAIRAIASRGDVHVVFPVHRNPSIWSPVHQALSSVNAITLLPPVDYPSFVHLMRNCSLVLTDSGGVQEEAPSFGVPVLVMRKTTERPEGVDAGVATLVGTEVSGIVSQVSSFLDDDRPRDLAAHRGSPFGDGQAARRIVDVLINGSCDEFLPVPRRIP